MNEDSTFTPEQQRRLQIIISKVIKIEDDKFRDFEIEKAFEGEENLAKYAKSRAKYLIERRRQINLEKKKKEDNSKKEDPLVGKKINNYQIKDVINSGGFGNVYKAEHVDLKYPASIKIFKRRSDSDILSWKKEAKSLLRFFTLGHKNIVRFLGASLYDEEFPYIIMEYIEGYNIDEYCKAEKPSVTEFLQLFCQLCSAVQFMHDNNIQHRDLKPDNILVTKQITHQDLKQKSGSISQDKFQVKVIDFGSSRLIEYGKISKHKFNYNPLTAVYASPEQIKRSIDSRVSEESTHEKIDEKYQIDNRSDIYSLGVLLYKLFTDKLPIEGDSKLFEHIRDETHKPIDPSKRVKSLPEDNFKLSPNKLKAILKGDLDFIIQKCLAKDRTQRYDTVENLKQDLIYFLKGKPLITRKISITYYFPKILTRVLGFRPGMTGSDKWTRPLLRLTGFMLLLVLSTGFLYFSVREVWRWQLAQQPVAKSLSPKIQKMKLRINQPKPNDESKKLEFSELEVEKEYLEILCEENQKDRNCFTFFPIQIDSFQMGRYEDERYNMNSISTKISKNLSNSNQKQKLNIKIASKLAENSDETKSRPIHTVTLRKEIYMTRFEVTNEQWNKVVKGNQTFNLALSTDNDNLPKTNVSYKQAKEFCEILTNDLTNKYGKEIIVRLPTEAEWEFSCRTNKPYRFGSEDFFNDNLINAVFYDSQTPKWAVQIIKSSKHPLPPSQFIGNEFGLSAMNGNVWEIVSDSWHNSYEFEKEGIIYKAPEDGSSWEEIDINQSDVDNNKKSYVMRGGAFSRDAYMSQCSFRGEGRYGSSGNDQVGFRLVLEKTGGLNEILSSSSSPSK